MGLVLIAHGQEREKEGFLRHNNQPALPAYFNREVLPALPEDLREALFQLSLLEMVPVPLAQEITGLADIGDRLSALNRKNFFVYSLDEDGAIFRLHHLFRDFMKEQAEKHLSPDEIIRVRRQAADYFLQMGEPRHALPQLLRLGDYADIEEFLGREGLRLVELNRIASLDALLAALPEKIILDYPWMSYFMGISLMEKAPPRALTFFEKARLLFSQQRGSKGELLTLAQLIQFHCNIDCQFHLGKEPLCRANELFPVARPSLDSQSVILAAMYLSLGFCIIQVNPGKARGYCDLALSLAQKEELVNLETFVRFNKGIQHAFFGKHRKMLREIENSLHLLQVPQVSNLNRMMLRILHLNALALVGDFENFFHQEEAFRNDTRGDLVLETVAGPILLINKIDAAVAEGRLDIARERIEQGLSWGSAAANPHLRSQFLHYQALVLALAGQQEETVAVAERSRHLRQMAGGEIWSTVSDMILGGALMLADRPQKAETLLTSAIEKSTRFGENFLRAGAYAYRACLFLKQGRQASALEDISRFLSSMRENGYSHFFTWTPKVMGSLLETAVRHGIEVDYARYLAARRLHASILDNGESIPLLRIKTFGEFTISVGDRRVLRARILPAASESSLPSS